MTRWLLASTLVVSEIHAKLGLSEQDVLGK